MFAVSLVTRYMHCPLVHHMGAVKRILHYAAGTLDLGIQYKHVQTLGLIGYVDSDWGGLLDDRRSTTYWVFSLGSGAIAWSSKKQDVTALSSTEAEYIAANSAACQGIWLRRLLDDMGVKQTNPTPLFYDNKSTIAITKNPSMYGRTKTH